MADLRKDLIRLAHENPELREHLLPILKEGIDGLDVEEQSPAWENILTSAHIAGYLLDNVLDAWLNRYPKPEGVSQATVMNLASLNTRFLKELMRAMPGPQRAQAANKVRRLLSFLPGWE